MQQQDEQFIRERAQTANQVWAALTAARLRGFTVEEITAIAERAKAWTESSIPTAVALADERVNRLGLALDIDTLPSLETEAAAPVLRLAPPPSRNYPPYADGAIAA